MNRLDLSLEETELIRGMLRSYVATLDTEIDHTDLQDFKRMLKSRRTMANQVLARCTLLPVGAGSSKESTFRTD